eukprot:13864233-Alexandrium_andersonii.AAC.1
MPSARGRSATVGALKPRRGPSESIQLQVRLAVASAGPRQRPAQRMSHPAWKAGGIRGPITPARTGMVPSEAGPPERRRRCSGPCWYA